MTYPQPEAMPTTRWATSDRPPNPDGSGLLTRIEKALLARHVEPDATAMTRAYWAGAVYGLHLTADGMAGKIERLDAIEASNKARGL